MDLQKFYQNILKDVKTELADEFDRNFQRKAFFDRSWPKNKLINRRGSQMARTNNLRRSLRANISGDRIVFSSSLPYASVQNEGGTVVVTAKMKRFFWAMYYQTAGKISKRKDGSTSNSKRNQGLTIKAMQWKNLALMKVGQTVKIHERRFIGEHPRIRGLLFCFGFLKSERIPKKEIPAFY